MGLIHKRISTAAATLLIAACGQSSSATVVSGDGFGPVRFGMKVEEAAQSLGVELVALGPAEEESCRYFRPANKFPGLAFMTAGGVIVRLDVESNAVIATAGGAKIGDSEQAVLDLYKGRVRVEPHKYTGPQGHYLIVTGDDGKVEMIFETDGSKVVSYRAGREPQVRYVEGCS